MEQQSYKTLAKDVGPVFLDRVGGDGDGLNMAGDGHGSSIVGHADWRRELREAIVSRVLPRLSKGDRVADAEWSCAPITEAQVAAFSDMVLAVAVPGLIRHIDDLRSEGRSIEGVVLHLMAPAARRLGDLWLEDKLSFLDVTAALGRLQGVMRALGPDFDSAVPEQVHGKKVLLAPAAGEQHLFGLSIVAAFFRRAGWDVTLEPRGSFDDLLKLVRAERFTAIGLSVANDRLLAALPGQVEALRRASSNPHVTLLAGGPAFLLDPSLRGRVGVDAVACDATEAVQMAEALSGQVDALRAG